MLFLVVALAVLLVAGLFALAVSTNTVNTALNALFVVGDFFLLILWSVVDALYVLFDVVILKTLFGLPGRILLASLLFWAAGAVLTESHPEIIGAIDKGICETAGTRQLVSTIAEAVEIPGTVALCVYNLQASLGRIAVRVFFNLVIECTDQAIWREWLFTVVAFFRAVGEATRSFFGDITQNEFPFYNPDPSVFDVWSGWKDILDVTSQIGACLCEDSFVQTMLQFVYDRLGSDFLGCAIDRVINSLLSFAQTTLRMLLYPILAIPPDYTVAFNRLCQAIVCLGSWVDETLAGIFDIFLPVAQDLKLGCIVARAICFVLEIINTLAFATTNTLFDCVVNGGGVCGLINFANQLNFAPAVAQLDQLKQCVADLLTPFDDCLGQLGGNSVGLFSAAFEFLARTVQNGEFDFPLLLDAVDEWVGQSRTGEPFVFHTGTKDHDEDLDQTSLTCVISRTFGDSSCAQAAADFINAVIEFFLIPFLLAEEILITDYSSLSLSGNPLAGSNRAEFDDLVLDLASVATDRFYYIIDSFGHVLRCVPGLGGLGGAFQQLADSLVNAGNKLNIVILRFIELVLQTVFFIIALVDGSIFGGGDGKQLDTFFDLFFDFFLQTFDIILGIVKGLIDNVLFFWFPALFDQGTLFSNNPGTAKFTVCIEKFDKCLCGLTKNILGDNICLPAGVGCLSKFWPNCGQFEPNKRYSADTLYDEDGNPIYQGSVYEYWADQFNGTYCGGILEDWRDGPMEETSIGEADATQYLNCIASIRSSLYLTHNTSMPADLFVNYNRMNLTVHNLGHASSALLSTEAINLLAVYSDPAAITGRPEAKPGNVELEQKLRDHGLDDEFARRFVLSSQQLWHDASNSFVDMFRNANPDNMYASSQLGNLVYNGFSFASYAGSYGLATLYELNANSVGQSFAVALNETGTSVYDHVREYSKRSYIVQSDDPDILERTDAGKWPFEVTNRDIFKYRAKRFLSAMGEYTYHLVGAETISPKYGLNGVLDPASHSDDFCTVIEWDCDAAINSGSPTGCNPEEFIFGNFRFCNDVFGHAVVTNCQEDPFFAQFNFYASTEACNDEEFRPPPTAEIFVGGAPLNETSCFDTGPIVGDDNATQADAGILCMTTGACIPCPVNQVFPGFTCSFLDEFVHEAEYLTRLCIEELGLGPPLPQIPDNFTTFLFDNFTTAVKALNRSSVCGNSILNDDPYQYINPANRETFDFSEEQCDPPGSTGIGKIFDNMLLSYVNVTLICGPACQWVACGNGILEAGEECDDGNLINGDGCSSLCFTEECGDGNIDTSGFCDGSPFEAEFNRLCDPFGNPEDQCGNNTLLFCARKETCDDGNRLDNDGCDRNCQVEKCPRVALAPAYEIGDPPICPYANGSDIAQTGSFQRSPRLLREGKTPERCFTLQPNTDDLFRFHAIANGVPLDAERSIEIDCKAGIPLMWVYENAICDGVNRPFEVQITDTCENMDPTCGYEVFGDVQVSGCSLAIGVGTDFTCTENCAVCGNNITEPPFEECDDGTLFVTGNATQDLCINCKIPCTCDDDPRVPCFGTCSGGLNNDLPCNVRTEDDDNNCLGQICVPFQCCGELKEAVPFDDGVPLQCDSNPDPTNTSVVSDPFCAFCIQAQCACVPGKPCIGGCFDSGTQKGVGFRCDVTQEPFACPEDNQVCIPDSCCGDGLLTGQEEQSKNIFDLGPNPPCEPGVSDSFCTDAECFYFIGGDYNPDFGDVFPGRLDECVTDVNQVSIGVCYGDYGQIAPITVYCQRNFTQPPLTVNQQCVDAGIANGICGARACCNNAQVENLETGGESETQNQPCEALGIGSCVDSECNYGDRFFFFDACECQPNSTCMGRCSFYNDATKKLCDPLDPSRSPWCPYDSDEAYTCTPIACCNDGDIVDDHGYGDFGFRITPLEDTDGVDADCGITFNTANAQPGLDPSVFTSCDCISGYSCLGYCVDLSDGTIFQSAGENVRCNPDGAACASGTCLPQACCGDGVLHFEETCDEGTFNFTTINTTIFGCNSTCGIADIPARKRAVQVQEAEQMVKRAVPVKQIVQFGSYQPAGSLDFTYFIFDVWDAIFNALDINVSSNSLRDKIVAFLKNTNTDIDEPFENWGILTAASFTFNCKLPQNTNCERGLGTLEGAKWFAIYSLIVFVVIGFLFGVGFTVCSGFIFSLVGMFIYLAVAYFYSPACFFSLTSTPLVPGCLFKEAVIVADFFNNTCIEWPEGVVIDPVDASCPNDCEREVQDCKDLDFRDGVDNIVFTLEVYFPTAMAYFRASIFFDFLNMFSYFADIFARFDYAGKPPPIDYWCNWLLIFNLGMVFAVLIAAGLIGYAGVVFFARFLSNLRNFLRSIQVLVFDEMMESEFDDLQHQL